MRRWDVMRIGQRSDAGSANGVRSFGGARRPAHLCARMARIERAQRWTRILGIGTLIVLSLSPVFLHHVARIASLVWGGTDQFGNEALAVWRARLTPVHRMFHAVLVVGALYAAWDRLRAWRRARVTLRCLSASRPTPGDAIWGAARAADVDPEVIRVVAGLPIPAFTVGWLVPHVYVAAELATCLSPGELTAVLAHEGAHIARRDPLLLSVLRFVGRALLWLPAVRQLAADVADDIEIRADDAAAARRSPLALAAALLAVARWAPGGHLDEALAPAGMVGIACGDLLERRVRRLAGEAPVPRTHVTRRATLAAVATLALLWASGTVVAHAGGHDDGADVREHVAVRVTHAPARGRWAATPMARFATGRRPPR